MGCSAYIYASNQSFWPMKQLWLLFILFVSCSKVAHAQQPITLEDIWQKGTYAAKGIPGFNFQNDGIHYTLLNDNRIEQYDFLSGAALGAILDAATIKTDAPGWKGEMDGYVFGPDEQKILISTDVEPIYRRSSSTQYFVYELKSQKLSRLFEGDAQRDARFSADGNKIAFVVNNDLYFKDLQQNYTVRVTYDGKKNEIINGFGDWVYEEEFELVRAFDFSPDGQFLAFLRFDEREVPLMHMETFHRKAYPEEISFKYPKVGQKNAKVTAWIYDLTQKKTQEVKTGGDTAYYLPRIAWAPNGALCLTKMNRLQNHLQLFLANPTNMQCQKVYEETNKAYLDLHDVYFLKDQSGFVLASEKSGFNHLYRYDWAGNQQAALTKGDWDVTAFYGIDERTGRVFYQAAKRSPLERELFSVDLNGKHGKKMSKEKGYNDANFNKTYEYFVLQHATLNTAPQYSVYTVTGKKVRELEQNAALQQKLQATGIKPATFFTFKTPDKTQLNGFMIKPQGAEYTGKKLPVLMFVYGGPGNQQVLDQWKGNNYLWFQMLAQKGYVVACVDNRGTGARGEAFKKCTYMHLGQLETQDQIDAARYLSTLSFVDSTRIGIFGWSYGGYMASLCMFKGARVFKAGISVAPVTHWKWYDSVYTERYMRTEQENPEAYAENAPVNLAEKLQGKFLLVHGLADDNVHFQHSAELANSLIAANKPFESMIYPNRNHGIGSDGARIHLYTLMTRFLDEQLMPSGQSK